MTRHTHNRTFAFEHLLITISMLLAVAGHAHAGDPARIKVMTQNQYLGADLSPLVEADDSAQFNAAMLEVLTDIGASNYPERVHDLARTIAGSGADLVGLQEMWAFDCFPVSPNFDNTNPCEAFDPAFNDHLQMTLVELADAGADYQVVAQSRNLMVQIPVFTESGGIMLAFVIDRDVILAREGVTADPFQYPCGRPQMEPEFHGCNFGLVASTEVDGIEIDIERGFVAVDATVRGNRYRFVNTHLEVPEPDPGNPMSAVVQSAQAAELVTTLAAYPPEPDRKLLVVGDINSDPGDSIAPFPTPYQQLVSGAPYNDIWTEKYKQRPGLTCCEAADLGNRVSDHDRRVDMIFSMDEPDWIRARTLNTRPRDKTDSGLWPSDHATVVAELVFEDDDDRGHDGGHAYGRDATRHD